MKAGKDRDGHFQLRDQDKQLLCMNVYVVLNKGKGNLIWPDGWMDEWETGRKGRKGGRARARKEGRKKTKSVNKW